MRVCVCVYRCGCVSTCVKTTLHAGQCLGTHCSRGFSDTGSQQSDSSNNVKGYLEDCQIVNFTEAGMGTSKLFTQIFHGNTGHWIYQLSPG